MNAGPGLGSRLRQARELAGFTQHEAADATGVAREVISYWENDRRVPSYAQLVRVAEALGVSVDYLLGTEEEPAAAEEHVLLYRGLASQSPQAKATVRRWLSFLDEWADLLTECGETLTGRRVSPKREWRAPQAITDSRLVPKLAWSVRNHYGLGGDAIPDLLAFLDQQGVLVYRAALDPIGDREGVSGLFYNHPRLGFAILVNTCTTPGRQTFTLAHEFAHALFHYQERGLVSRTRDPDRKERFADAFAAHLLVPGEKLRELVDEGPDGGEVDEGLSPFDVLRLHRYFRVSYATMLNRLRGESLLSQEQYDVFRGYSPSALAKSLGFDCTEYEPSRGDNGVALGTYPPSVLERVRRLVQEDELSPAGAADLLHVSQEEILGDLLAFASAEDEESREFVELPLPSAPRGKRRVTADW
jgi:transcriptional regulator with XRE-family HTH domain/Zn-dependent peptidase ImmA (M78 family)